MHLNKKVSAHCIQACAAGVSGLSFSELGMNHQDSWGALGTKVHQPFLSPDFAEIPESPEYSWTDSTQSLRRPYGLHLPQTHTNELQTVPSLSGAKQMSLPSNRRLPGNALSFPNDQSFYLHLYRTEGDLRLCPTPFLENPTAPCRKPSPCNCFCRGTGHDVLIYSPLDAWALKTKKHTHHKSSKQTEASTRKAFF